MLAFPPVLGYIVSCTHPPNHCQIVMVFLQLTGKPCDSALDSLLLSYHSVCSLTCENEGIFKAGTCTCDCADGFGGANCGSKLFLCCNTTGKSSAICVFRLKTSRMLPMRKWRHLINHSLFTVSVCTRVCSNGGTLNPGSCTCACRDGFSGANCEGECI